MKKNHLRQITTINFPARNPAENSPNLGVSILSTQLRTHPTLGWVFSQVTYLFSLSAGFGIFAKLNYFPTIYLLMSVRHLCDELRFVQNVIFRKCKRCEILVWCEIPGGGFLTNRRSLFYTSNYEPRKIWLLIWLHVISLIFRSNLE